MHMRKVLSIHMPVFLDGLFIHYNGQLLVFNIFLLSSFSFCTGFCIGAEFTDYCDGYRYHGVKPAAFCTMAAFHDHIHRFINPDQG